METKTIPVDVINGQRNLTDYVRGGETGAFVFRSVIDWSKYLPDPENQFGVDESDECATFSGPEHCIEAQVNYDIAAGNYSTEALAYFTSAGYMMDGKFRTSSLFNAKMNGTTQQGNSFNTVAQSAHTVGLLPWNDLPMTPGFTWAQYEALVISPDQIEKAKKLLDYISIQYQWVDTIDQDALSCAPIQIATAVCEGWFTDTPVKTCQQPVQHATMLWGLSGGYQIRDTYAPYDKLLARDYVIGEAMQYIVKPMPVYVSPYRPNHTFNPQDALALGDRGYEVREMHRMLAFEGLLSPKLIAGDPRQAVFGQNTLNAVNALQAKYKDFILSPAGVSAPTGKAGYYTLSFLNSKYSHPMTILDAQTIVESVGDDDAIGDLDIPLHAFGCLQLRQGDMDEVNAVLKTKYQASDCLGNRNLSILAWETYFTKCHPEMVTDKDKAFCWNGGSGWRQYYGVLGYEHYTQELNNYWNLCVNLIGK